MAATGALAFSSNQFGSSGIVVNQALPVGMFYPLFPFVRVAARSRPRNAMTVKAITAATSR